MDIYLKNFNVSISLILLRSFLLNISPAFNSKNCFPLLSIILDFTVIETHPPPFYRFFQVTRTKTSLRYAKENDRENDREKRERRKGRRRYIEREGDIREIERERGERDRESERARKTLVKSHKPRNKAQRKVDYKNYEEKL